MLQEAGFVVANVAALDKKQGSFKAVTTTTAVKQDLVGKTTVLDSIDFVRDCLTHGPVAAVESRGIADFNDLTWLLEAPSWVLSDGTLRMLALTLPAFLPAESALYMVEEPENGVHPKALEIILRSLSAIPDGQMLLATHSPFVVQQCGLESLLCFSRDGDGTHVTPGPKLPMLKD